jgi:hypothetical protein
MSADFDQRFNDLDSQLSALSVRIEAEQGRLALNATQFEADLSRLHAEFVAVDSLLQTDQVRFEGPSYDLEVVSRRS